MGPDSEGKVVGKENLKKYCAMGIEKIVNLFIEFLDFLVGMFFYLLWFSFFWILFCKSLHVIFHNFSVFVVKQIVFWKKNSQTLGVNGYAILYKRESGAYITDIVIIDAHYKAKVVRAFSGKKP